MKPDQPALLFEADDTMDLGVARQVPNFMIAEAALWAVEAEDPHGWPRVGMSASIDAAARVGEARIRARQGTARTVLA
jgi:hypothetical protein